MYFLKFLGSIHVIIIPQLSMWLSWTLDVQELWCMRQLYNFCRYWTIAFSDLCHPYQGWYFISAPQSYSINVCFWREKMSNSTKKSAWIWFQTCKITDKSWYLARARKTWIVSSLGCRNYSREGTICWNTVGSLFLKSHWFLVKKWQGAIMYDRSTPHRYFIMTIFSIFSVVKKSKIPGVP